MKKILSIVFFLIVLQVFGAQTFIINDFESPGMINNFTVDEGDNSSLNLTASYNTFNPKESKLALSVEYSLSTTKLDGTFIKFYTTWQKSLNLSVFSTIVFYIRGDGTENQLTLFFTDKAGHVMRHQDSHILNNLKWEKVSIKLSDFKKQKDFDLTQVAGVGFQINSTKSADISGVIYIDKLFGNLTALESAQFSKVSVPPLFASIDGTLSYQQAPGKSDSLRDSYDINISGSYKNVGLETVIRVQSLKYDYDDSETENDFGNNTGRLSDNILSHYVKARKILFFVNNPLPGVSTAEAGNIRINYSPYTVYKIYGYEGLHFSGYLRELQWDAFYFKGWNHSYTIGGRVLNNFRWHKLRNIFDSSFYYKTLEGKISENSQEVLGKTVYNESGFLVHNTLYYEMPKIVQKFFCRNIKIGVQIGTYSVYENTDISLLFHSSGVYTYKDNLSSPFTHKAPILTGVIKMNGLRYIYSDFKMEYFQIGDLNFLQPESKNKFTPSFIEEGIKDNYTGLRYAIINYFIPTVILSGSYGSYTSVEDTLNTKKEFLWEADKKIGFVHLYFSQKLIREYDRLIDSIRYDEHTLEYSLKADFKISRKIRIKSEIQSKEMKFYRASEYRWTEQGLSFYNYARYKLNNKASMELIICRTQPDNFFASTTGSTYDNYASLTFNFSI